MKRITVVMDPGDYAKRWFGDADLFEKVNYMEGTALLRYDSSRGVKVAIAEIGMKEGYTLDDLSFPSVVKVVDILDERDNVYTCLFRVEAGKGREKRLFRMFDMDFIFDPPSYADSEKMVFSIITHSRNIERFIKALRLIGVVKDIKIQKADFSGMTPLSALTPRQRSVLLAAKRYGYYSVPRRITIGGLARKLGLSKATTAEHLQKAEKRIMEALLAGY